MFSADDHIFWCDAAVETLEIVVERQRYSLYCRRHCLGLRLWLHKSLTDRDQLLFCELEQDSRTPECIIDDGFITGGGAETRQKINGHIPHAACSADNRAAQRRLCGQARGHQGAGDRCHFSRCGFEILRQLSE